MFLRLAQYWGPRSIGSRRRLSSYSKYLQIQYRLDLTLVLWVSDVKINSLVAKHVGYWSIIKGLNKKRSKRACIFSTLSVKAVWNGPYCMETVLTPCMELTRHLDRMPCSLLKINTS